MDVNRFNIRVYGLLVNQQQELLITHEKINGFAFTKFPGGGLEFGEGTHACIIREFKEEANIDVTVEKHLYTTDFFQQSAFNKSDQLISIYYLLRSDQTDSISTESQTITHENKTEQLRFEWVRLNELNDSLVTFPIDKLICRMIMNKEITL
jgi:8-oxo-dGTP diphosphatase